MSDLDIFIRQVRSRSTEHLKAMKLLHEAGLVGQTVSVLRQELDSMIRVVYLLAQDRERRNDLISASVNGTQWSRKNSKSRVTDREMVELASELNGWTKSVYKFGCAFIHLSDLHDYNDRDPLQRVSVDERKSLIEHCRFYHGGPKANADCLQSLIPYFPEVLKKVTDNLHWYLQELENNMEPRTNEI